MIMLSVFCILLSHCLCSELQAEVEEHGVTVGPEFFQSSDFVASHFAWDKRELITWSKVLNVDAFLLASG